MRSSSAGASLAAPRRFHWRARACGVVLIALTSLPTLSPHTESGRAGWRELDHLGARSNVFALNPPKIRSGLFHHLGVPFRSGFRAIEGGYDYALCIPRTHLDTALVQAAREQGVEVRERTAVHDLMWEGARVCGVRHGPSGERAGGEIRAPLVVGADGRRSTVAGRSRAEPYRGSHRGRGFVYWYMDDPKLGTAWREMGPLFRVGETIVLIGPMPSDRMLVLLMCPAEDVARFRRDPEGRREQALREDRRLADRVAGATRPTRMFSSADIDAFVRPSSGPGWALVGDAGHFKDPGIAQGIPDSLVTGVAWERPLRRCCVRPEDEKALQGGGPRGGMAARDGGRRNVKVPSSDWMACCASVSAAATRKRSPPTTGPTARRAWIRCSRCCWRRCARSGEARGTSSSPMCSRRAYIRAGRHAMARAHVGRRALARPGADRRLLRQAAREVTIDFSVRTEHGLAPLPPRTGSSRHQRPDWHAPKAASR